MEQASSGHYCQWSLILDNIGFAIKDDSRLDTFIARYGDFKIMTSLNQE
jgi:hypothetical protein